MAMQPRRDGLPPDPADDRRDVDPRLLEEARAFLDRRGRGLPPGPGQAAAWDRFYREQAPFVRSIVHAYRPGAVDAEDAAQEVWSALLARLGAHRHDAARGRFRAWLFVLARHRLSDLGRHAARRAAGPLSADDAATLPGGGDDPSEAFDRERAREQARAVLEEFRSGVSEANYRIIHLRWIEGRTVAEVAAALGLTPARVRARHHRLMGRLRVLAGRRGEGQDDRGGRGPGGRLPEFRATPGPARAYLPPTDPEAHRPTGDRPHPR